MTEVNDYLFTPLFCGTRNLPQTVGMAGAVAMLLGGERWSADAAFAGGLLDEIVPHEQLAERKRSFVARVLAGAQPSRRRGPAAWGRDEDVVVERTRRWIRSLPPQYQSLYDDGLALLEAGGRGTYTYADHQRREFAHAVEHLLAPAGRAAAGFFYLRQMASERATGRIRGDVAPVTLGTDVAAADPARAFVDDLRGRKVPGVRFGDAGESAFRFVGTNGASRSPNGRCPDVAVRLAPAARPPAAIELYAPAYAGGGRLVELASAARPAGSHDPAAPLARVLQRFGFEVARTMPAETFVSDRLLIAYLAPLVRFVLGGGDPRAVDTALRHTGFVRLPGDVLDGIERDALAAAIARALGRVPAEVAPAVAQLASERHADALAGKTDDAITAAGATIIDAAAVSLLDAVATALAKREARDISIIDLIARELLDFPRHLCSLSTWLKTERIAAALARGEAVAALAGGAACASAQAFVAAGKELYR